jgi:hypothetical protein
VRISSNYSNPSFEGPFNNIELIIARQPETDLRENSEKKKMGSEKLLETYNLMGRFE